MRRRVYYPGAARDETFELPVISILLKHPQGNVLFDSGCNPNVGTDPEGRLGGLARAVKPIFSPDETLPAQLPLAGVGADDIDLVICSHLHFDHCGCNSLFGQATVMCHAKEYEGALAADAAAKTYFREDWDNGRPIQTFDAQHDVFGDGRLTLLPMPGHTPGMTVAHAVLDQDGAFLLASDAAAVQANLDERNAPTVTWDVDQSVRSLDEIATIQRQGAVVIFGHDDAQWRGLRQGAAFYA